MSESATSRSKTVSESDDSASSDEPSLEDRWSYNITYRQLVMSSCIGIFQFCYHPYVYDVKRLLPFVVVSNVCSVLVGYPVLYLELAVAAVTRKGVLNCWDLAPVARGVGFAMLACCTLTALCAGALSARCLALLVHSAHSFLPWLHCAAGVSPPCAARHRPLPSNALTPAHSFYNHFVLDLKPDGLNGGLGNVVWELAIYYIISWTLIYCIAIKRIYSYSKLVLCKDVMSFFVLWSCAVGVTQLDGAGDIFRKSDFSTVFKMWREAMEYALLELSISQGTLAMLGSYCPPQKPLGGTAVLTMLASKVACTASALVLGATHSALVKDYDGKDTIDTGSSSSLILWADLVARIPGSQFWSMLLFFTLFVLSTSTAALLVQTLMSSFTGRSMRKIRWAFLILTCVLFCLIGVLTLCTQGGQYILDFLLSWPVSKPRLAIAATVTATITYIYGQKHFCEDVYFAATEYPNVFVRVSWALSPAMLLIMFITSVGVSPGADTLAGWTLVALTVLPVTVVMMFYLVFKCRVRNILQNEK